MFQVCHRLNLDLLNKQLFKKIKLIYMDRKMAAFLSNSLEI